MNWREFFDHKTRHDHHPSEEERYQAFKARILHEQAQARAAAAEREARQHDAIMAEIDPLGQG